jgi:uncharacterized membrane protein (DUF106 family)
MELSLSEYSIIFYAVTFSAAAYVLFYQFIVKRFGNPVRVKEIQEEMNRMNKNYQDSLKSKDESRIKKAEQDQSRIFSLMMESMKYQFIPFFIVLPIIFVLPSFLKGQFPVFEVELPFSFPVAIQHFERFPNWRSVFGTFGWFFMSVFFISSLSQIIIWLYNKATGKDKKKQVEKKAIQ